VAKLYVGNLPWGITDEKLYDLFSSIGPVESARIITDRNTGKSRGFGFVVMGNSENATAAINRLNGEILGERKISVSEAVEKSVDRAPKIYRGAV